jgi:type II secretory pathway pseudopilin PulG
MNPSDDAMGGFSTLEMLVAFVILSLGLAVAVQAISQATMRLTRAEASTRETTLVRKVIREELPKLARRYTGKSLLADGPRWKIDLRPLSIGGLDGQMQATIWIAGEGRHSSRPYTIVLPSLSDVVANADPSAPSTGEIR